MKKFGAYVFSRDFLKELASSGHTFVIGLGYVTLAVIVAVTLWARNLPAVPATTLDGPPGMITKEQCRQLLLTE